MLLHRALLYTRAAGVSCTLRSYACKWRHSSISMLLNSVVNPAY